MFRHDHIPNEEQQKLKISVLAVLSHSGVVLSIASYAINQSSKDSQASTSTTVGVYETPEVSRDDHVRCSVLEGKPFVSRAYLALIHPIISHHKVASIVRGFAQCRISTTVIALERRALKLDL